MAKEEAAKPAVEIKKVGEAKPDPKAEAPKEVKGVKQKLVQLLCSHKNVHALDHAWTIVAGLNHVPAEVWALAKTSPVVQKMIKEGLISEGPFEKKDKAESAKEDEKK